MNAKRWVAVCLCVAAGVAVRAEVVDKVVASVGDEVILLSDLMAELGPQLREIRSRAANEEEFKRLVTEKLNGTLDQAIENKLLYREAQNIGMNIEEKEIERRLDEYRKLFGSSEEFLQELERTGETMSDLRERLRQQMYARTMAVRKMKELEQGIAVSETDVAAYYDDNREKFEHPERVYCSQIFLPAGNDLDERAVVRARLEQLRDEIVAGAEFSELAIEYSKAPGAEDGGTIGWVLHGDLVQTLDDAVFALEPREMSEVVETDAGFHLLYVERKEAAGVASIDDARVDIEPELRSATALERYKRWITDLRKRSKVQVFM